jgi:diketogulonate reductase-like aldo/keto reductase
MEQRRKVGLNKVSWWGDIGVRIALAWMLQKKPVTSIIIGAKNNEQLIDNIASTLVKLSDEEMKKLDKVSELASEYPGWMVARQSEGRWPES